MEGLEGRFRSFFTFRLFFQSLFLVERLLGRIRSWMGGDGQELTFLAVEERK